VIVLRTVWIIRISASLLGVTPPLEIGMRIFFRVELLLLVGSCWSIYPNQAPTALARVTRDNPWRTRTKYSIEKHTKGLYGQPYKSISHETPKSVFLFIIHHARPNLQSKNIFLFSHHLSSIIFHRNQQRMMKFCSLAAATLLLPTTFAHFHFEAGYRPTSQVTDHVSIIRWPFLYPTH
jgi:hypothetical protein